MSVKERARRIVEEFAVHAEKSVWGCDHVHYKGLDDDLERMIAEAIEECLGDSSEAPERLTPEQISDGLRELPPFGSVWRHYGGNLYIIIAVGYDTDRGIRQVSYRRMSADAERVFSGGIWERAFAMSGSSGEGPVCHKEYTDRGWLRVEPDGTPRFKRVDEDA